MGDCQASLEAFRLLREQIAQEREQTLKLRNALVLARVVVDTELSALRRAYTNFSTGLVDEPAREWIARHVDVLATIDNALEDGGQNET